MTAEDFKNIRKRQREQEEPQKKSSDDETVTTRIYKQSKNIEKRNIIT